MPTNINTIAEMRIQATFFIITASSFSSWTGRVGALVVYKPSISRAFSGLVCDKVTINVANLFQNL